MNEEKIKLTVCWTLKGRKQANYKHILKKFGIPDYISVNHETPCLINEDDLPLLKECEERGFLVIRYK